VQGASQQQNEPGRSWDEFPVEIEESKESLEMPDHGRLRKNGNRLQP
jgi:hypothetical protein